MARVLMKGNEAVAEAAIRAGCQAFFGYPITPQNEIPEYLAREMPKYGRLFLQTESELAAINMVLGASATGARVMTSSSGPGICHKLEGISNMAMSRLPAVIVNMVRVGPGMGNVWAGQDDYRMAGNGAYKIPILLPGSVQEAVEMTYEAFDIADQYRTPVLILADGMIGQMMEAVDFDKLPAKRENLPAKTWSICHGREKGTVTSVPIYDRPVYAAGNFLETELYPKIIKNECKVEVVDVKDADIVLCAYGTAARMARSVIMENKDTSLKIGLIRPKTAWPYPYNAFDEIGENCKAIIVPEVNIMGLMIDDVRIAANDRWPIYHCGNTKEGSMTAKDIALKLQEVWEGIR